jgi:hypothetical protein
MTKSPGPDRPERRPADGRRAAAPIATWAGGGRESSRPNDCANTGGARPNRDRRSLSQERRGIPRSPPRTARPLVAHTESSRSASSSFESPLRDLKDKRARFRRWNIRLGLDPIDRATDRIDRLRVRIRAGAALLGRPAAYAAAIPWLIRVGARRTLAGHKKGRPRPMPSQVVSIAAIDFGANGLPRSLKWPASASAALI